MEGQYDFAILGGGVAGLSAGIYAARYLMKTVIVRGKEPGGETASAAWVENYPGFKKIDGFELVKRMEEQAVLAGVELRDGEVIDVLRIPRHSERSEESPPAQRAGPMNVGSRMRAGFLRQAQDRLFANAQDDKSGGHCFDSLVSDGAHLLSRTICFAVGARSRRLGLPKEKELTGKGISYCTICDAPLYKGKEIAIVGGGDASIKGANLAGEYVSKIYLIVRGTKVKAEPVNWERFEKNLLKTGKAEVLYGTEVVELVTNRRVGASPPPRSGTRPDPTIDQEVLTGVCLSRPYKGTEMLKLGGLFVQIGAVPNNEMAKKLGVELDEWGYINVDKFMRTNIDGVFAAGDITNGAGTFRQDIIAAAQGAMAATSAYQDLGIHGGQACEAHALPVVLPSIS